MSQYKHKIVLEAGTNERVDTRVTFEQFYETKEQQVENQERLFTAVSAAVAGAAVEHRDANFSTTG